jgi:hypothetical protein
MTVKYNLVINNLLSTVSGTKVLTEEELISLSNGDEESSIVTLSATEQLSLLVDLKARYNLEKVVYYRTAATTEDIKVYARQNDLDIWYEIATTVSGSQILATLSGTYDRYQTVNVIHSVSEGTASPLEVELYTNDDDIKFGSVSEGFIEGYPLSSGDSENSPQEVFINNIDSVEHEYLVLIEDNEYHSAIEVSLNNNGPYYSIRDNSVSLSGTYPWSSGVFSNTTENGSGDIVISASTSGTYFSPVIDASSLTGPRIFWETTNSGLSVVDSFSDVNSQFTIGVRISNLAPEAPWTSGQTSSDGVWDVVSGTLPFLEFANNTILKPEYKNYVQFKVQFIGDTDYPKLHSLGLEYPLSVTVSGNQTSSVFVRSLEEGKEGNAELITWFFEPRTLLN